MARDLRGDVLVNTGPDQVAQRGPPEVVDDLVRDAGGDPCVVERDRELPDRLAMAVEDPGREVGGASGPLDLAGAPAPLDDRRQLALEENHRGIARTSSGP
jgi:hypothetical protein